MLVSGNQDGTIFSISAEMASELEVLTTIKARLQRGDKLAYGGCSTGVNPWLDIRLDNATEIRLRPKVQGRLYLSQIADMARQNRGVVYIGASEDGSIQIAGKVCKFCGLPLRLFDTGACNDCRTACSHSDRSWIMSEDEMGDIRSIPGKEQCLRCGAIIDARIFANID